MASVRKRLRNGKMEGWVADYFDQAGKRHIKTFEREREAKAWLNETLVSVKRGTHTPESASITLAAAAKLWLARPISMRTGEPIEKSTLVQYENHVDKYLDPRLGTRKLSQLTTPEIARFLDKQIEEGVTVA